MNGIQVGRIIESGTSEKYCFSFSGDPVLSDGQGVLFDLATSPSGVDYAVNITLPPPPPAPVYYGPIEAQMADGVSREMAIYWLTGKKG